MIFPKTAQLLLCVFICYRLSRLVTVDEGPFYTFERIRIKTGLWAARERQEGTSKLRPLGSLAELFQCPHCIGVWIAFLLTVILFDLSSLEEVFLIWLSIAGGQSFLEDLANDGT
jgi:hypothetical protein